MNLRYIVGRLSLFITYFFACILCSCDEETIERDINEGISISGTQFFHPLNNLGYISMFPKINPTGTKIAYQNVLYDEPWGIYIFDIGTEDKNLLVEGGYFPNWSPDGQYISYIKNDQVRIIRIDGSEERQVTFEDVFQDNFRDYTSRATYPEWISNEKIIYNRSVSDHPDSSGIFLLDLETLNKTRLFLASMPNWNGADSKILAVNPATSFERSFSEFDLNIMSKMDDFNPVPGMNNQNPRYSPDGSQIIFYNNDGIYSYQTNTTQKHLYNDFRKLQDPSNLKRIICCPSWFPDGKSIIYQRFEITKAIRSGGRGSIQGTQMEGIISFMKLDVEDFSVIEF